MNYHMNNLALYYRIALLLIVQAIAAWLISFLFVIIGQPASSYALYTMIASTLLTAAAILVIGFAKLFLVKK